MSAQIGVATERRARGRNRRVVVVSPSLDKRQGTERCLAEQVERLAWDYGYEVHVYSQRVEDVAGVCLSGAYRGAHIDGACIVWHRVPSVPGPGVLRYLWWFVANHACRWWHEKMHGFRYDAVYSPGINCFDADVVSVHIVFAAFYSRIRRGLSLRTNPLATWPRILHRRLYYRLIIALERRIYPRGSLMLAAVSRKTAEEVAAFYRRSGDVRIVYNAVDAERFSPQVRARLRSPARRELNVPDDVFSLLLVGNDWKKKGLECLLEAVGKLPDTRLSVLVVGNDDRRPFEPRVSSLGLEGRVHFLPPRPDIEFYYAAADAYVGPSLHDSFALPPIEAMACGMPVVVSSENGGSEIMTDGVDGLIVRNPRDPADLAARIRRIVEDGDLRHRLARMGVQTARQYTWDRNAAETVQLLEDAMSRAGRL